MKKGKEFECKQECETDCCSFTVIKSLVHRDITPDEKYLELHNIEVKEVEPDLKLFEKQLIEACKKKLSFGSDRISKLIFQIIKRMFKEYHYKIPQGCSALNPYKKCNIYKVRPNACKVSGSGGGAFRVEGCPY